MVFNEEKENINHVIFATAFTLVILIGMGAILALTIIGYSQTDDSNYIELPAESSTVNIYIDPITGINYFVDTDTGYMTPRYDLNGSLYISEIT